MTAHGSPRFPIERITLANGLRVVLSRDEGAPVVAVNLWYHVGAKNEQPGKTGFAHLFEHMLFEGSKHVPDKSFIPTIQRLGGDANGSTGPDTTNYYETVPSEYLPLALWLESDRMGWLLPAMTQEKLDNQRSVVKNEKRWRYDNQPYGLWFEHYLALAYPDDFPYHHTVIGSMEDLDGASLSDVEHFFETYYTPRNSVLSIVGDFQREECLELVNFYFGSIPAGPPVPPVAAKLEPQREERRKVLHEDVQLGRIFHGYHAPPMGHPDFYAASLVTDVLSAGRASRLYQSLVYEQQVAQEAASYSYPLELTSSIFLDVTAKPGGDVGPLEAALLEEVERLRREPPGEREMERVRNQIASHHYHGLQTVNGRADQLSECTIHFGDPERALTEVERYLAVTADQVTEAARTIFRPENRTAVIYVPSGEGSAP